MTKSICKEIIFLNIFLIVFYLKKRHS